MKTGVVVDMCGDDDDDDDDVVLEEEPRVVVVERNGVRFGSFWLRSAGKNCGVADQASLRGPRGASLRGARTRSTRESRIPPST